ncbi:hypothetical protein FRB99_003083 [Tulasnella sp. 403]|nr:hypothetical protein FRB99_003083 [Tulasnella sp. 403]
MSAGTLWTTPAQSKGLRVRAVAAFGGIDITLAEGYEHRVTNKTPEYTSKFASGKIPALETSSGFKFFETTAIARYIAGLAKNSTLLGSSAEDQALIDQWVSFADDEIYDNSRIVNLFLTNQIPYSKPGDNFFRDRVTRNLTVLESHLASRTFLVTERITLADISVASVLKYVFPFLVDASQRAQLPNTVRFFNTIANQPSIQPIFGETKFVEKAQQYTPPPKAAKPAKEAAPAAPKEKPAKAAAKEAEDEEEEETVREEPKPKNPLDLLPKSSMPLDDWKRAYSNLDTRGPGGSLEWLYQHYDAEGYSLWKVVYKYNEELEVIFKSSNLIGGFFNRLEASRKYLFGSMGVLGTSNDSIIAGAFIARGKEYKPVFDVAPDWESYDFTPLDLSNDADKAYFEAALAWDLEIDGKKWADGKVFK